MSARKNFATLHHFTSENSFLMCVGRGSKKIYGRFISFGPLLTWVSFLRSNLIHITGFGAFLQTYLLLFMHKPRKPHVLRTSSSLNQYPYNYVSEKEYKTTLFVQFYKLFGKPQSFIWGRGSLNLSYCACQITCVTSKNSVSPGHKTKGWDDSPKLYRRRPTKTVLHHEHTWLGKV